MSMRKSWIQTSIHTSPQDFTDAPVPRGVATKSRASFIRASWGRRGRPLPQANRCDASSIAHAINYNDVVLQAMPPWQLSCHWYRYPLTGWRRIDSKMFAANSRIRRLGKPLFTARRSYANAVLWVLILSVCLSHACFVTKPNNELRISWYHAKGQSLIFWHQQGWWATPPSVWNLHGACVARSLCHSWATCWS